MPSGDGLNHRVYHAFFYDSFQHTCISDGAYPKIDFMKRSVFCLAFGCAAVLSFCREFKKTVVPAPFEYAAYVAPYDFAGCIEKVVLNAGREILEADVNVLDFDFKVCLYSSKNDEDESGESVVPGGIEILKSHKKITEAYLSDSLGLP